MYFYPKSSISRSLISHSEALLSHYCDMLERRATCTSISRYIMSQALHCYSLATHEILRVQSRYCTPPRSKEVIAGIEGRSFGGQHVRHTHEPVDGSGMQCFESTTVVVEEEEPNHRKKWPKVRSERGKMSYAKASRVHLWVGSMVLTKKRRFWMVETPKLCSSWAGTLAWAVVCGIESALEV